MESVELDIASRLSIACARRIILPAGRAVVRVDDNEISLSYFLYTINGFAFSLFKDKMDS